MTEKQDFHTLLKDHLLAILNWPEVREAIFRVIIQEAGHRVSSIIEVPNKKKDTIEIHISTNFLDDEDLIEQLIEKIREAVDRKPIK